MDAEFHARFHYKLELLSEFLRSFHEKNNHDQVEHAFLFMEDMFNRAMIPHGTIPPQGFTFIQKVERALICKMIDIQQRDECVLLAGIADIFAARNDVDFDSRMIVSLCSRLTLFNQYSAETPDNRTKYLTSIHRVTMHVYNNCVW